MMKLYIIAVILILGIRVLKGNASESDGTVVTSYPVDGGNVEKVAYEINELKVRQQVLEKTLEVQKKRVENLQILLQSQFEKVFTKLENLTIQGNTTLASKAEMRNHESPSRNASENVQQKKQSNFENSTQQNLENLGQSVVDVRNNSESRQDLEDTQQKSELSIPSGCAEALSRTHKTGVYAVKVDSYGPTPFDVYCDSHSHGGNWTVVQRRKDGSVDFYRNWDAYKRGFGDLSGEFFIGLDKLHALTSQSPQELLIKMENFEGTVKYARYADFAVGSENENFALNALGEYSGNAGDSLSTHRFMKFSTFDRDNDEQKDGNCAEIFHGAWWYSQCSVSNLNGRYNEDQEYFGFWNVYWFDFEGYRPLKRVQISIRPKSF